MKPRPFDYQRASSLADALQLLEAGAGSARLLAGGQSLIPVLNFRLDDPKLLIDINGISEMAGCRRESDRLVIGALTVINPLLVDEQIRGGVVQGIGAALWEECRYDENGQFTSASLVDYLVPMSVEMPDIDVHHLSRPTKTSALGTRGVGETGTTGAIAAVLNAVNDALAPFDVRVTETPCSPRRILSALKVL